MRLRRVARTRSTQDIVLHAARSGAAEGLCCIADEQTAGRGRQGRAWSAPPGSALLVSVLLRRSPAVASGVPFAAGLALVDSLEAMAGVSAGLKWPNDVLVEGRKLAGILCEVAPSGVQEGRVAIALGMGVNLRVGAYPDGAVGISLHDVVERPPDAEALFRAWIDRLWVRLATLERGGIPAVVADWRAVALGLGQPVTVRSAAGTLEGIAVDVEDDGALLVRSGDDVHRVLAGDVHIGSAAPAED
ncbi:MAG TPA: biotin--[acetyl-CoA-carboxylase] ligase [Candidatus Dormibacteraeota bacterium]